MRALRLSLAAALALAACAGDSPEGSRARVYHPLFEDVPGAWPDAAVPPEAPAEPRAEATTPSPREVSAAPAGGAGLRPGAQAAGTSDSDPYFRDFIGAEPPELPREGTWITPATATTLVGLRGQVVYLQFAFLGCSACALTMPHLSHWHEAYGPRGLVVLYVDNGLTDRLPAARDGIAARGMTYPVFYDTEGKALLAYGIRAFPTAYLIGKDGKVIWEGNPLGIEAKVEEAIVKALP